MTLAQGLAFSIVGAAVALFVWGRFRYDLVAVGALLAGVLTGVVKPANAFSGLTSDVVVIIACALVMSAAIARSGVIEQALRPLLSRLNATWSQVIGLAGATAVLSMLTKNVGALAILMPVAIRKARTSGTSRASLLMPMSFMSLLGGLVTLVGTSTNIIVSQVRQDALGKPFAMFDFAPVGLVLTAAGLAFVSVGWRLLPRERAAAAGMSEALDARYATEARAPDDWPEALETVADLDLASDGVRLTAVLRDGQQRQAPFPDARLGAGDTLVLEGEQEGLANVFARTPLEPAAAARPAPKDQASDEIRSIEAVIEIGSVLVGRSAAGLRLRDQFGINLLAVSRSGQRIDEQLSGLRLCAGDVVVLQAGERALPPAMQSLGLLPLVERDVQLGAAPRRWLPAAVLAAAMVLVALNLVPVAIGFFGAAVLTVALGGLSMREAYASLDARVLVLIGALTPLSEAIRTTGGAALAAGALADLLHGQPAILVLGVMMVASMACSPFLHNAPTVLVLGPLAVALAGRLHLSPDAFLMAVATGAGCDFLTPVGHQSNTLVMGPGGYRFSDYARLGLPLSCLVVLIGVPMIALVWPLARS